MPKSASIVTQHQTLTYGQYKGTEISYIEHETNRKETITITECQFSSQLTHLNIANTKR